MDVYWLNKPNRKFRPDAVLEGLLFKVEVGRMGTALLVLQLIGGLLPIISQGILTVEAPGVSGADKAAAVTDLAVGTLEAVAPNQLAKVGKNNIFAGIAAAITHLVAAFNKSGQLPAHTTPAGGAAPKPTVAGSAPGA